MSQLTPGPAGPIDPATRQPYAPVPPKPRSWFARHKVLTTLGALVVLVVVIAVASQGGGKPADASLPPAQAPASTAHETIEPPRRTLTPCAGTRCTAPSTG